MLTQAPPPHIFISYNRADLPFVRQLADDLRRTLGNDEAVWYDAHLKGGDEWWRMIREELRRATIFLVVCSPAAMKSDWVNDEIDIAWRRKNSPSKLRISPLHYQPCQLRDDLASLHIIDFLAHRSYQNAFQELLFALNILPSKSISSPSFTASASTVRSKRPPDAIYEPDHNSKQQQAVSESKALLEEETPTSPKTLEPASPLQEKVQPSHRGDAHQWQSRPLPPPSQSKKKELVNRASFMKPPDAIRHNQNRQKAPSMTRFAVLVATIAVVLLVAAGGVVFLPDLFHSASTATSAAATATAHAQSLRAALTATALPTVNATTQTAKHKDLSALTKGTPTIQGFQAAAQWSNQPATAASSCTLNANNTSTVNINITGQDQYNPCLAAKPMFTNLVMQVTMKIQGDVGGIIFRSDNLPNNSFSEMYYRLSVNQSDATTPTMDTFSLIRCDTLCAGVTSGTSLTDTMNTIVHVDRTKPVTLTLIARVNTFDVFIDGQFVASTADPVYTVPWQGQIGVYAASLINSTTVTFSNLKVWDLGVIR